MRRGLDVGPQGGDVEGDRPALGRDLVHAAAHRLEHERVANVDPVPRLSREVQRRDRRGDTLVHGRLQTAGRRTRYGAVRLDRELGGDRARQGGLVGERRLVAVADTPLGVPDHGLDGLLVERTAGLQSQIRGDGRHAGIVGWAQHDLVTDRDAATALRALKAQSRDDIADARRDLRADPVCFDGRDAAVGADREGQRNHAGERRIETPVHVVAAPKRPALPAQQPADAGAVESLGRGDPPRQIHDGRSARPPPVDPSAHRGSGVEASPQVGARPRVLGRNGRLGLVGLCRGRAARDRDTRYREHHPDLRPHRGDSSRVGAGAPRTCAVRGGRPDAPAARRRRPDTPG